MWNPCCCWMLLKIAWFDLKPPAWCLVPADSWRISNSFKSPFGPAIYPVESPILMEYCIIYICNGVWMGYSLNHPMSCDEKTHRSMACYWHLRFSRSSSLRSMIKGGGLAGAARAWLVGFSKKWGSHTIIPHAKYTLW